MSLIGIVCEYNPFHNGHKYLIDAVKGEGDTVVAVMSGNFVQRAEPAVFPKEHRAKAALLSGVDIVVELPFLYAVSSAEIFGNAAVNILNSLGCDKLAFGSESGDITELQTAADILSGESFYEKIKDFLSEGMSYPSARQCVYNMYGGTLDISSPNNILALEYLKALKILNSDIVPVAVKRVGAGYNDNGAENGFASATYVRACIAENKSFADYVPPEAAKIYEAAVSSWEYVSYEKYNTAFLTLLRSKALPAGDTDFSNMAYMAEGLENRIISAVKASTDIKALYDTVKTKRFTHSRIRRAVLSAGFGINSTDIKIPVPYIRLLGFNKSAEKVLGTAAKNSTIPFAVNYKDIAKIDTPDSNRVFALENASTDFYNMILNSAKPCSTEMTYMPCKIY